MLSVIGRVSRMFHLQTTLTAAQVPPLYREPGILSGYRPPRRDVLYYVISAVQANNETVNIWTHLVGLFFILHKLISYTDGFQDTNPRLWPFIGFCVCCLLYTCISVCAHVAHSKSHLVHYTCFQLDYAGIAIYVFGGAIPIFFHGADVVTRQRFERVFLPANLLFSWVCFVSCCVAKLKYRRPYPFRRKLFQVIPFGLHSILTISLLAPRALRCYHDNCDDPALAIYKHILILAMLTALTFTTHLPEKLWPGKFDYVGQGHHLFHVLSTVLSLRQCDAAYQDALSQGRFETIPQGRHDALSQGQGDTLRMWTIPVLLVTLCVMCVLTILLIRPFVRKRVAQDKLLEKTA